MQANFTAFGGEGASINIGMVIGFAVVLSFFGIISKLIGAGIPALFVGFNRRGVHGELPQGCCRAVKWR